MPQPLEFWVTLLLFTITYLGLAVGKLPGLRTDRAGIALCGAAGILATGLLPFDEAITAIDFATLGLLLGMMVVVAFLRRAGFFEILAGGALHRLHGPFALLAVIMVLSAALSALLVNDIVCLALTPLALQVARKLGHDPRPHLIGLALASNIGSTATLTGNPQNIIIGGLSEISYLRFASRLAPVALLGLFVAYGVVVVVFRRTLSAGRQETGEVKAATALAPTRPMRRAHRALLLKSGLVTLGAVVGFLAGAPMAVVALAAAAILLLERIKPDSIYRQIDWSLLVMFAGLFVVVHAFELHVLRHAGVEHWTLLREHPVTLLSLVSALLSNLVSNVPAVLLFKPIVPTLPIDLQERAWLALAMSSTLAGNLTILGSVANLIVVENARRDGVTISLADYCRVGVPVTLATLALGIAWLRGTSGM